MKTNTMMRIASVLLVAVLLSTCAIAGTYAKYTTTVNGTATAHVATWEVTAANEAETFSVNILETIKDSDGVSDETDVKSGCLAPGMTGSFTIEVVNSSEVNAQYTATLGVENYPLEFSFANNSNTGKLGMEDSNKAATITVNWEWPFAEDDDADLALQGQEVTIDVTIVFEQVD